MKKITLSFARFFAVFFLVLALFSVSTSVLGQTSCPAQRESVCEGEPNCTWVSGECVESSTDNSGETIKVENPVEAETFSELARNVLETLWLFAVPVAVILFAYSGYIFLLAKGDEEDIKRARRTIVWTAVGLIILFLAQSLVSVISEFIESSVN